MKPRHLIPVGSVLVFSIVSAVAKPVEKSLAVGQQEEAAVADGTNVAGPAEPRATAPSGAAAERGVAVMALS